MQTSKEGHVRHVCFRCLNTFKTEKSLASHHEYCKSHEAIKIELSKKGSKISFTNYNRAMRVPFVEYADFESFTPLLSTCQPNPDKSYNKRQKHTPSGFCYHIKCFDDTLYSQELVTFVKEHNDDDVAQIFINTLEKNIKYIYKKFKFPKCMIMTMHDKLVFDNSTLCHICNEDRVRDHYHLPGKFRGAAHEICNLKEKISSFSQLYFTTCQAMIITYSLKH